MTTTEIIESTKATLSTLASDPAQPQIVRTAAKEALDRIEGRRTSRPPLVTPQNAWHNLLDSLTRLACNRTLRPAQRIEAAALAQQLLQEGPPGAPQAESTTQAAGAVQAAQERPAARVPAEQGAAVVDQVADQEPGRAA